MSNSKTKFGGKEIRRVHRSEFDDLRIREVARQDLKLGHDIRTMERARNVVKKSMDAEKQMFIKSGPPSTGKMSRSQGPRTNPGTPTRTGAGGPASRFVPDSKTTRKTSTNSDDQDPVLRKVSSTGSLLGVARSGRTSRSPNTLPGDLNNNNNNNYSSSSDMIDNAKDNANNNNNNEEVVENQEPSIYDSNSLYADFLKRNLGPSVSTSLSTTSHSKTSTTSSLGSTARGTATTPTTTKEKTGRAVLKGKQPIPRKT